MITIPRTEIGQGVMTGLAQLIVEELAADWANVRVVHSRADRDRFGSEQNTVASQSIFDSWTTWREAAAAARRMLEQAACARWNVPLSECRARQSRIHHIPTGRMVDFGEVADAAARLPVPARLPLKTRFDVVGRPHPRVDGVAKCTGTARYGLDVRLNGLLTAVVIHPPRYGEEVERLDARAARARPGVLDVLVIPHQNIHARGRNFDLRAGVAVIALDYWTAWSASALLNIFWTQRRPALSNDEMGHRLGQALTTQQPLAAVGGPSFIVAEPHLSARYEAPFLAHATMEPMNCTADVTEDACTVWVPTQAPLAAQAVASVLTGLPEAKVTVETTFAGGGFGRRTDVDYVSEAVHLSKRLKRPLKTVWPREEDMRQDYFRPAAVMELSGATRGKQIVDWNSRLAAGSSTSARRGHDAADPIDWTLVLGAHANPYAPANFHSTYATVELGPPTGYMRGVSNGYTCFANESFVDELAAAVPIDPVAFRLANLSHDARAVAVLQRAAELVGWGDYRPGRHLGLALLRESRGNSSEDYNLCVATVVELLDDGGADWRISKITLAADFGEIVNPDQVRAQLEGGAIFGLSAALKGKVDFVGGEPQQTNFHDYPVVRMNEAPPIEIALIRNHSRPGGVGEKGVAGIAPALANALFAATGRRQRTLPLMLNKSA